MCVQCRHVAIERDPALVGCPRAGIRWLLGWLVTATVYICSLCCHTRLIACTSTYVHEPIATVCCHSIRSRAVLCGASTEAMALPEMGSAGRIQAPSPLTPHWSQLQCVLWMECVWNVNALGCAHNVLCRGCYSTSTVAVTVVKWDDIQATIGHERNGGRQPSQPTQHIRGTG